MFYDIYIWYMIYILGYIRVTKVRECSTSPMRRGWNNWNCSIWRSGGSGEILLLPINASREGAKRTEPGYQKHCPLIRHETMDTNWTTRGSVQMPENTYFLCGWRSMGMGCVERLWSLCRWRSSKAIFCLPGHGPEQPAVGVCDWAGTLDPPLVVP